MKIHDSSVTLNEELERDEQRQHEGTTNDNDGWKRRATPLNGWEEKARVFIYLFVIK